MDENIFVKKKKQKLKRELQAEALARLERAARTEGDFQQVTDWWDRLDANRERRERYHEVSCDDEKHPFNVFYNETARFYPLRLSTAQRRTLLSGNFLDEIFNCAYEMHELMTGECMSSVLKELKPEYKELLYSCAILQYSTKRLSAIRGTGERNIRKVRATMIKRIRKNLLKAIRRARKRRDPLTGAEVAFFIAFNEEEDD